MRKHLLFVFVVSSLLLGHAHAEQSGPARRVLAADDSTGRLAIVAPDGSLEWEIKVGAIHDAWVRPNGNILFPQGWTKIVEITPGKGWITLP